MEFVKSYPVLSVIIALFASMNLFVIAFVFYVVWKEELKEKVKKQNVRIVSLLADNSFLKERNDNHMIKRIDQGIEIERLKDELKEANKGAEISGYVEDMTRDYLMCIEEKEELKRAFKDASVELNKRQCEIKSKTEYCKRVESDNEFFRNQYAKAMVENDQLKEQLRLNELRLKHKKLTPKTDLIDSKYWRSDLPTTGSFIKGKVYEKTYHPKWDFCLIGEDDRTYICDIKWFCPVPSKTVVQHVD